MMMKLMRGAALMMVMASPAMAQDSGIEIGVAAPAAAVSSLDGKPANLSRHIGKMPVVMEFWATWCPVCKELEPAMAGLFAKYGTKVTFVNVAVSVNQSPALVQRYVKRHKMGGIHYFDTKGDATGLYDVPATSYVVVVDRSGKVVYTGVGGKQGPKIEAAVKRVIR
ncbi:MAG: TlpA disulfide reductase family protein [Gemmatimonadaceae bacterium]